MKRWVHYGLLSLAALFFIGGVGTILIGYLRYLDVYETYRLEICQVINRTTFIDQSNSVNYPWIEVQLSSVPNSLFTKWLQVPLQANYSIGSTVPCYALLTIANKVITVHDIELEAYSDMTSLIIGLALLAACFFTILAFILIVVFERKRRRRYDEVAEVPSDFRYQDHVIYHRDIADEENLELVLQSFDQAQGLLWRNQSKLREQSFDRLRHEQIDALMGSHAVRIKFQQDVYAALKALQ